MTAGPASAPDLHQLTAGGRRWRTIALIAFVVLLAAGNQLGEDDHFPFAPMRMYAHKTTGEVKELQLMGMTADGAEVPIGFSDCRLRRAEAAGQVPLFQEHPSRLRHIARACEEARPGAPRLEGLRLLYVIYPLTRQGKPSGQEEETLAVWTRS
ncbi:hypothetical protein BH24ACT26_BH24ACT26_04320 [soil metagenome]